MVPRKRLFDFDWHVLPFGKISLSQLTFESNIYSPSFAKPQLGAKSNILGRATSTLHGCSTRSHFLG
jgi:hypothetical protein